MGMDEEQVLRIRTAPRLCLSLTEKEEQ
jgi:hypothetical protein